MLENDLSFNIFKSIKIQEIENFCNSHKNFVEKMYKIDISLFQECLIKLIDKYSYILNIYLHKNYIVLKYNSFVQEYTQIKDIIELTQETLEYNLEFKISDCYGCDKNCDYNGCIKIYNKQ